jgi:hypothetical protein
MNCSPTLTADEFKTIHNALWELDSLVERLDGVINQELYTKLYGASRTIRSGLKSAYEQDDTAFTRKNDHYTSIQEELSLRSIWSVYEVDNLSEPHPFEGATHVVYKDHWGGKPVSKAINGLTWAALYVAADACIRDSGDEHHVFIEQFEPIKGSDFELNLSTGS